MAERPTLLFIPGVMSDAFAWRAVECCLATGWKTRIVDVSAGETITAMAELALQSVEGAVIPVGHSLGGRIAFEMSRLRPERIVGLVVADTGIHPLADGELAQREEMIRIGNEEGMNALAEVWLPPMIAGAKHSDAGFMDAMRAMMFRAGAETHERQIRALIDRPDARAYLPSTLCPTLVIVGDEDGFSPVSHHEEMVRLLPNAELCVINGAGHFAQTEQPEAFGAALKDWLTRTIRHVVPDMDVSR